MTAFHRSALQCLVHLGSARDSDTAWQLRLKDAQRDSLKEEEWESIDPGAPRLLF